MKSVVIIGGGIAGLTAGIYLQQAGFQTKIYEKHSIVGGQCTGWTRKDCFIDNCIHWLTGTKKGTDLYQVWENVGALGSDIEMRQPDAFCRATLKGETITLWRDLERTKQEMITLSPADEVEINRFINAVKLAESLEIPAKKPFDLMNPIELVQMAASMSNMSKVNKHYGNLELIEFAHKFQHPLLQYLFSNVLPDGYQASSFIVSYATVTSGNGNIPKGGSRDMALRMQTRYESLGGTVYCKHPVHQVLIDGKKAIGIQLTNGKKVLSDYVIAACDPNFIFSAFLNPSYMPKSLKEAYEQRQLYPVFSSFQVAFCIEKSEENLSGTTYVECKPMTVAHRFVDKISYKSYDYEPSFAPKGKYVLQLNVPQSEKDYDFWFDLYQDKAVYEAYKMKLARDLKERLISVYPFLDGKVELLDTWTPMTYSRYCHAYKGAYMSFTLSKGAKNKIIPGTIKDLTNVFIASQWLMSPGGLPTALIMGKFAAQRIIKKEKA